MVGLWCLKCMMSMQLAVKVIKLGASTQQGDSQSILHDWCSQSNVLSFI